MSDMTAPMVTVIIMAKECVPGRVKTRLHPPFSLEDAAKIAQASLNDTIAAVGELDVRRALCVQGVLEPVPGFEQIPQAGGGLDERIADIVDRINGPVLLIGMDTPQVDPELLRRAGGRDLAGRRRRLVRPRRRWRLLVARVAPYR